MGNSDTNQETLYVHGKRTNWGMAILAFEGEDHRRYQFQDGQLRTFKDGYYHLLVPVEEVPDNADEIIAELEGQLGVSRARRELVKTAVESAVKVIKLESQIEWFGENYEGGFQGDTWNNEVRGEGAPRRLKKQRAVAIIEAGEKLGEETVRELMANGEVEEVGKRALAVLKSTNLTRPSADLAPLEDFPMETLGALAADLLYGEGEFGPRLERFVAATTQDDAALSWPGATALAALVNPTDHVCVRPSTARLQARWVAPLLEISDSPKGAEYEGLVGMNRTIFEALQKAGFEPRDLMDVTEFSRITLRPAVRKQLTLVGRR